MQRFKYIIFFALAGFICAGTVLAYQSPGKATGYVNDFAGVLAASDKAALENKLGNYSRPAGVQIVVAIVPSLAGDSIDNFAVQLFAEWGIGQKIKDNGILILVAPTEKQARIEVGYGLEGSVTDAMASVIVNTIMIPDFKAGNYYSGLDKGTDKVMALIDGDPEAAASLQPQDNGLDTSAQNWGPLIVFLFIVGLNLMSVMARTKSWWLGGVIGLILGFIFVGTFIGAGICAAIGLAVDFVLSKFGDKWPKGPGGGIWFLGGMGGNGFGGRGGGFGGFGGGRSGGGGASGGW